MDQQYFHYPRYWYIGLHGTSIKTHDNYSADLF